MENKTGIIPRTRCTEKEEAEIRQAADKKRMTISEWVRACMVSASKRVTGAK
jgi:hypothetical protein